MRKLATVPLLVCLLAAISQAQSPDMNILAGGKVVASGYDGMPYYIYEGDFDDSPFTTRSGTLQDPAYVGVLQNRRMTINQLVIYGGNVYEDGGWFDSAAKPVEVQIMANPGDPWTPAMTLTDYPSLDGIDFAAAEVHNNLILEVNFSPAVSCVGIRVAGKGASGNNPEQSFVSINEMRAFGTLGDAANTYTPPRLDGAFPIGSTFRHPLERGGSAGGDVLIDGIVETYARMEELPAFDDTAFFGFYSANPLTLTSVSFIHGKLGEEGWINTEFMEPTVQIKRARTGEWETVGTIDNYPDTNGNTLREELPDSIETQEFKYTFTSPTEAHGVRIVGNGSFFTSAVSFIQIGEIMIEGTGSPAFSGPAGDGLDGSGNPFAADADGIIFIEAERARSVNDSFTVKGHGDSHNGLVAQCNWGASFNLYSGQELQWDVQIPQTGDYYIFLSGDSPSGWGDSLFVTWDNNPDLDADNRPNLIHRPPGGDPAYSPVLFELDWITTDALGGDGQEFYTLTQGQHTLRFGLREPRFTIDWIAVTDNPDFDINAYTPPVPTGVENFSIY